MFSPSKLQAYVPVLPPRLISSSSAARPVTRPKRTRRARHADGRNAPDAPASREQTGQYARSRRPVRSPSPIIHAPSHPPQLRPPPAGADPLDTVLPQPSVSSPEFQMPLVAPEVAEQAAVVKQCTVYGYNLHMKKLSRRKDLRACLHLLRQLRQEGLAPDKYTYSTVLGCCAAVGAVDTALEVYEEMREQRVAPDDYVRTNLLSVAARASPPRLELCARVFRSTQKPGRVMCNILMDAYGNAGMVQECLTTYRYMGLREMQADKYTVSALVKAYVRAGRLEDAFEKTREMHAAGLNVTSAAFGQVMDAFGREGKLDRAVDVFDAMVLSGVQPTQITYNILIGACARLSMVEKAFEIYEEMKAASIFHGDRYTLHSLMKCCIIVGDGSRALELYRVIRRAPFPCNQVSYRLALTAAGQVVDLEAALEVFRDMMAHKVTPREDTAAVLVAACIRCSDLESALEFFRNYTSQRIADTKVSSFFVAIRHALQSFEKYGSASGDFEHTSLVVDELEKSWLRGLRQ